MVCQHCTEDHVHYSNEHFQQAAQRLLCGIDALEKFTCDECQRRYRLAVMGAIFQMECAGGEDNRLRAIDALMDMVTVAERKPIYDFERKPETPQ